MSRVHEKGVDDAVSIWVVRDTNPHALSPKIRSYVQGPHWFRTRQGSGRAGLVSPT